ncbi:MAG: YdcF family protein [Alphaproteobacteria bacterium]|nr:YdcF family protein [Alphaproteobacteria bacterium]
MTAVEGNRAQVAGRKRRRAVQWLCAAPLTAFAALAGGFLWFAFSVAREEGRLDRGADGIVALTGGASRIADAVELLASGRGRRLLITGVGASTNAAELMRLAPHHQRWFGCCIDLGYTAANTAGNAVETGRWAQERGFRSLVVVTSGYHMPRAMLEIHHRLPDVTLIPFPVVSEQVRGEPWWRHPGEAKMLVSEYLKFLVAMARIRLEPVISVTEIAYHGRTG